MASVSWDGKKPAEKHTCQVRGPEAHSPLIRRIRKDLSNYFTGKKVSFDWPLDWSQGTAFQRKVWKTLRHIPYGGTRSYQWVAARMRHPSAVRAVGQANGRNPFSLIIPCHRVIQKDGSIGGYTGGLSIKRRLLAHEA